MSVSVHAMDNAAAIAIIKEEQEKKFNDYLLNGNSDGDQLSIRDHNAGQWIQTLHEDIKFYTFTNDLSTRAYAISLPDMPTNEVVERYNQYKACWKQFMATLITKQILLNALKKESRKQNFNNLAKCFNLFEKRMVILSRWLTAARNSGEEDYMSRCMHGFENWSTPHLSYAENPGYFWDSVVRPKVLSTLQTIYESPKAHLQKKPLLFLNPTSMATLRHQLYHGFKGFTYKQTTEYSGPAICRLKFKGGKTCNWSYQELMRIIALAEKEKKRESNNLLAGINEWRKSE
jgi:hypothetical protein